MEENGSFVYKSRVSAFQVVVVTLVMLKDNYLGVERGEVR